jgi:hypothetical protein
LIYYCGEWLESENVPEDLFFVGLLFWKPNMKLGYQGRLRESNFHNLGDNIAELEEDTTGVVSVYTGQFNLVSDISELQPSYLAIPIQFQTNHTVFGLP